MPIVHIDLGNIHGFYDILEYYKVIYIKKIKYIKWTVWYKKKEVKKKTRK